MSPTFDKFRKIRNIGCSPPLSGAGYQWQITEGATEKSEVNRKAQSHPAQIKQGVTYVIRVTPIWSSKQPTTFRHWKVTAENSTVSTNPYCPASMYCTGKRKKHILYMGYLSLQRSAFYFRKFPQQILIKLIQGTLV